MAIDFIVHLERRGMKRVITQISEVLPPADALEPAVNQVFIPDGPNDQCVPVTAPQSLPDLIAAGFDPAPFMARSWEQVRSR